jgi:polysaccharide biosynthesis/export protein
MFATIVKKKAYLLAILMMSSLATGCGTTRVCIPTNPEAPRELAKATHPSHRIEAPDILQIDAVRVVPLPPYKLNALDILIIRATNALPEEPIGGSYQVEPEGTINLGPSYGTVQVVDMTVEQARLAIEATVKKVLANTQVSVTLGQSRGFQQIQGNHLVRPDGTISLGLYGAVRLAGLTIEEAKAEIETHLAKYLLKPEVNVDIFAYNSKVYYVIFDGAGNGETVTRLPSMGNETVLDAMSQVGGIPSVGSKHRIWIARPAPEGCGPDQILPIDWKGIAMQGRTSTNYQLLPGDRLYVMAKPLISLDNAIGFVTAPFERLIGLTFLINGAYQSLFLNNSGNIGNNANGFGF